LLDVVGAATFLATGQALCRRLLLTLEIGHERLHPRAGEQCRRVGGNQAAAGNNQRVFVVKKLQIFMAQFISGHARKYTESVRGGQLPDNSRSRGVAPVAKRAQLARSPYALSLRIERAAHAKAGAIHGVQVNLCCAHIFVSEQILHGADIVSTLQQMSGEGVAQSVR
jgi:hypothetical protein